MYLSAYRNTEAGIRRKAVAAMAPVIEEMPEVEEPEAEEPAPWPRIWTPTQKRRAPIAEIAERHEVSLADVLGPSRFQHVVRARFAAIRAVRQRYPEMSLPQLGRLFNRDHTTILHALRKEPRP